MQGGRDISSRAVVTPLGERVGKYECGLPPSPRDGNQDVVYCAARRETGHLLISWTISGALGTSGEKSAGNVV